jgi:methionyl-tRNA formyltransferase
MRIAFLGTPEFANPSLNACIDSGEVVAVITQPDRRRGRGKKLLPTQVKKEALKHNIEVYQPKNIKNEDAINYLKALDLDVMVVVAYGQILSKEVLDIPKYGCINVHASILPKLRGAAPINWAIVRGHDISGVTTMQMDVGLDTGDMLDKVSVPIDHQMTAGELHDVLKDKGAKLLKKTLNDIENDALNPEKQKDELSTYAPMIDKKMAKINWENSADDLHNLVRGFNPWPVAYTTFKDKKMKIYDTKIIEQNTEQKPGSIISVNDDGFVVQTGENSLLVTSIQLPSKKRMTVKSFLNGHTVEVGTILGG